MPKSYDPTEGVYHVYGIFDDLACAKAFILDQSSFNRGHQMGVFHKMARDVYGVLDPFEIVEMPPRVSLRRFGGPFDPTRRQGRRAAVSILEPPFVSYCMLAEERTADVSIADGVGVQRMQDVEKPSSRSPPPARCTAASCRRRRCRQRRCPCPRRAVLAEGPAEGGDQRGGEDDEGQAAGRRRRRRRDDAAPPRRPPRPAIRREGEAEAGGGGGQAGGGDEGRGRPGALLPRSRARAETQ